MSALLFRLGGVAAAHPWRTIAAWLAVLAVAVGLSLAVGGQPRDDYRVAGSPAQVGADFLAENFDGTLGSGARVVVHAENGPVDPAGLAALGDRLRALPQVTGVEPAAETIAAVGTSGTETPLPASALGTVIVASPDFQKR